MGLTADVLESSDALMHFNDLTLDSLAVEFNDLTW